MIDRDVPRALSDTLPFGEQLGVELGLGIIDRRLDGAPAT